MTAPTMEQMLDAYVDECSQRLSMDPQRGAVQWQMRRSSRAAILARFAELEREVDVAYIAGALAMQEKVARALETSPRKVIYELGQHVRARINPPSVDECRQWNDDAAIAQRAGETE